MGVVGDGTSRVITWSQNWPTALSTYPISFGGWFFPRSTGAQNWAGLFDTTTGEGYSIRRGAGSNVAIRVNTFDTPTVPQQIEQWQYVVARFVSSSMIRGSFLFLSGAISHVNGNPAGTPAAADNFSVLGKVSDVTTYFTGACAEIWLSSYDCCGLGQPASDLDNELLRQLAYCGPLSVFDPYRLYLYQSFFDGCSVGQKDDYWIDHCWNLGEPTVQGSPQVFQHPPIYANYLMPRPTPRIGIV